MMPSELITGVPTTTLLPCASSTSSFANSFSIGASNLIVTSGVVTIVWPADGCSSSGNECADASGPPPVAITISIAPIVNGKSDLSNRSNFLLMDRSSSPQIVKGPVACRDYRIIEDVDEPEHGTVNSGPARIVKRELRADAHLESIAYVRDTRSGDPVGKGLMRRTGEQLGVAEFGEQEEIAKR